jgi:hypothetical protein
MMGDQGDRTMNDQRTVRRRIAATVIAIGVVLFGVAVAPGGASASSVLISGTTSCRVDSWTVTWTARADADRNLNWSITSPSGYAPSGFQDDTLAFTRTATYPGSQASATENISAHWSNNTNGVGSATVARPPLCEEPTTTTTTTTTVPETTTTTTTTLPVTTTSLGQQAPTTTTTQVATTTTQVGQQGPTTTVGQSSGATTTTVGPGGQLPPTGAGDGSVSLIVIALTLVGIGAVMLRMATKPTR